MKMAVINKKSIRSGFNKLKNNKKKKKTKLTITSRYPSYSRLKGRFASLYLASSVGTVALFIIIYPVVSITLILP